MRMKTTLGFLIGALLSQQIALSDDLFRMTWRGTVYVTGANGQIVARPFTERDFINKVATDNGLAPGSLVFVYRPTKHDTAIVRLSDGGFVADVIQMETAYTDVSNTNQTRIVRQAFLADEQRGTIGSAFGNETARFDANGNLLSDVFHGTFQYAINDNTAYSDLPAWLENASPPFVFSGSFATGARVKDTSQ